MKPVSMLAFRQINPWEFEIDWSDHKYSRIDLATLQGTCPCAHCVQTREQAPSSSSAGFHCLKARRVSSVGRYAIRVQFEKGCSLGIYTYDQLRNLHLSS